MSVMDFTNLINVDVETFFHEVLKPNCSFCRQIHGNLGSFVAEASEIIEPEEWHHLVYRYDAQSECSSN